MGVTQESFRTALEREVAALWAAAKEPMNYGAFDQFLAQVKKCFVVDSPVMRVFTQRVAAVLTAPTVDSQVLGTTPWTLRFAEEALLDLRGSMHAFADAHGEVYSLFSSTDPWHSMHFRFFSVSKHAQTGS